jgi:hypothetical protein
LPFSQIEGDDFSSDSSGRLSAYVSYGGLLMRLQASFLQALFAQKLGPGGVFYFVISSPP